MEKNSVAGHRARLREKFLQGGLDSFLDYEIVELLLTLGTPRKDCKKMAKDLIEKFGDLRSVLDADLEELQVVEGIGPSNAFGLKLFQAVSERLAEGRIPERLRLDSMPIVADFLQKTIGREKKEHFMALYLDMNDHLIEKKIISVGILNTALVHPREVFKPAVSLRAAKLIVAHNHPSGNTEPSSEDREITRQLVDTGKILGIEIRDHFIVSQTEYFSFQQQLLL